MNEMLERSGAAPDSRVCRIERGVFGRWIIVNAKDRGLAWSGSRWALHKNGVPAGGVQISNFDVRGDAVETARSRGLAIVVDEAFLEP